MTTKTGKLIGIVAVTGTLLIAGAAVLAHGGFGPGGGYGWGGPGWRGHHGMMGGYGRMHGFGAGPAALQGDPVAYMDQRLTGAKEKLKITADQQAIWDTFADAAREKANLMMDHFKFMHEEVDTEQRLTMMQQGAQQMQRLATAARELYAALTPEQKATADQWVGPRSRLGRPRWAH